MIIVSDASPTSGLDGSTVCPMFIHIFIDRWLSTMPCAFSLSKTLNVSNFNPTVTK